MIEWFEPFQKILNSNSNGMVRRFSSPWLVLALMIKKRMLFTGSWTSAYSRRYEPLNIANLTSVQERFDGPPSMTSAPGHMSTWWWSSNHSPEMMSADVTQVFTYKLSWKLGRVDIWDQNVTNNSWMSGRWTVALEMTSRPWKETHPGVFLESFTSGSISPAYDVRLTSGKKQNTLRS